MLLFLAALGLGVAVERDVATEAAGVLAEACFACHGPDEASREAGLRLDGVGVRSLLEAGSPVLSSDDPTSSLLLRRIMSSDPAVRMPPPEAKLDLSPADIEVLQSWVHEGAPVLDHWSFRPRESGGLELDEALIRRAEAEGLVLSAPAAKEAWLRRASFVLTGLAPSAEELDRFLGESGDGAYAAQVDRLLASPRYGERMAVDWLDLARYSDTYGYQSDVELSLIHI